MDESFAPIFAHFDSVIRALRQTIPRYINTLVETSANEMNIRLASNSNSNSNTNTNFAKLSKDTRIGGSHFTAEQRNLSHSPLCDLLTHSAPVTLFAILETHQDWPGK